MKKRIEDLLRQNYLIIPFGSITEIELSFLSEFFSIQVDEFYFPEAQSFKKFFVLKKKNKYQPFSHDVSCCNPF